MLASVVVLFLHIHAAEFVYFVYKELTTVMSGADKRLAGLQRRLVAHGSAGGMSMVHDEDQG